MTYTSESIAPIIEALLFASDEPLSAQELRALILGEEFVPEEISAPAIEAQLIIDEDSLRAYAGHGCRRRPR